MRYFIQVSIAGAATVLAGCATTTYLAPAPTEPQAMLRIVPGLNYTGPLGNGRQEYFAHAVGKCSGAGRVAGLTHLRTQPINRAIAAGQRQVLAVNTSDVERPGFGGGGYAYTVPMCSNAVAFTPRAGVTYDVVQHVGERIDGDRRACDLVIVEAATGEVPSDLVSVDSPCDPSAGGLHELREPLQSNAR